ncbi:MAG: acyl-CoA dehydrogenase family protein [bacterium]
MQEKRKMEMNQAAGLSPEICDMVIQTLRQVVQRDLPEGKILELDHQDEFPLELIQKLLSPEVGLHLVFLPESVGGLGGGARDICRISEEMASIDLGVATAFLAICLGTDPILVGGTETQQAHWLGKIATEGLIVAYGVTEPEAGSNVAALKTVADQILDADGQVTGYRLNGVKQFITNGGVAQLYTILAKTPGGPSFFVAERDTPGLQVGKKEDKHGIRASNTASVLMEDMDLPVENLICGEEGQGLKQANAVFGYTRLMVGAFGLGGGQAALDRAVAYAKTREQFGAPLIEKEGFTHKLLVPHFLNLAAGRAYVDRTALRIDSGEKDLQVEGSIAKYWCTEAGCLAANAALQALGGYGYIREYMVEKHLRDVRITTIYEGTSEIQQNIIGLFRWKETVRSKGKFYATVATELDKLHQLQPEASADRMASCVRGLNEIIQHCHAGRLTRNQFVLFKLADLATRVEVGEALTRKAALLAEQDAAEAPLYAAMSRVFARETVAELYTTGSLCAAGQLDGEATDKLEAARALDTRLAELLGTDAMTGQLLDMDIIASVLKAGD